MAAFIMQGELNEALDGELQEAAPRLLDLSARTLAEAADDVERIAPPVVNGQPHGEYLFYQVRDASGRVLLRSNNAPPEPLPVPLARGFQTIPRAQVYTVSTDDAQGNTLFLHVAEPSSHRREALRDILSSLLWPLLLLIPASAGAAWWIVRRGMRPVRVLQAEIGRRDGGNLAPVDGAALARELAPMARSVNLLLGRLRAALEAERALAANSAHELRTPLAAALAQTQRLIAELAGGPGTERAGQVERALRQLADLAEKLLQLSRAEAGMALSETDNDLLPAICLVVEEFAQRQGYRHRLILDVDGGRPLRRRIDIDAFGIALRNLIENALAHGNPDEPVRVLVDDGGAVHVVNGGPPVPADVLGGLKARFSRGPTAAAGSGLGLAIADTIVRQAGGTLDLRSPAAGQGDGFETILALPPSAEPLV
jgi:two-component system OmpR family sensor kinase